MFCLLGIFSYPCWVLGSCREHAIASQKLTLVGLEKPLSLLQLCLFCSPADKFLKALKDEKLQGLKTRQPGKKSASLS